MNDYPLRSRPLRILMACVLLASTIESANAAEWLFVGAYYTRKSSDSCAEGGYVIRDAKDEAGLNAIDAEFNANEKYRDKKPFRFQRGGVPDFV